MQSLQGGLGACRSRIRARMEGKPEALHEKPGADPSVLVLSRWRKISKRKPSGTDNLCSASCGQGKRTLYCSVTFGGTSRPPYLIGRNNFKWRR